MFDSANQNSYCYLQKNWISSKQIKSWILVFKYFRKTWKVRSVASTIKWLSFEQIWIALAIIYRPFKNIPVIKVQSKLIEKIVFPNENVYAVV